MACNTMSCKKLYLFHERYFRRETFSATVCRSPINRIRVSFILFFSFSYYSLLVSLSFPAVTATSLHYRTLSPRTLVSQSTSIRRNLDSSFSISLTDPIRSVGTGLLAIYTTDAHTTRTSSRHNIFFYILMCQLSNVYTIYITP